MTTADIQQLQYAFSKAQERNEELQAQLKASNASNDALVEMVLKHEATIKTLTAERDELKERGQLVAGWNEITVGLGEIVKEMKAHIDELEANDPFAADWSKAPNGAKWHTVDNMEGQIVGTWWVGNEPPEYEPIIAVCWKHSSKDDDSDYRDDKPWQIDYSMSLRNRPVTEVTP